MAGAEGTLTDARRTPAGAGSRIRNRVPVAGRRDPGAAPAVLAVSAFGVLLVALGYAWARAGAGPAVAAYWTGQVVVFVPVAYRVFSRRLTGTTEAFLLSIGLAVNQYVQKWLYSPDQFRFPDELQHWVATTTLLRTGRLFEMNLALPVATRFPGLAEMAGAVASLTGLSAFASGLLVAGVARLVFVGALFVVVTRSGGTPAFAAATCVGYSTALHYLFFDAMFIYQTGALPFLLLSVWAWTAWWRRTDGGANVRGTGTASVTAAPLPGVPVFMAAMAAMLVATVTHHVTALAMVGTLLLLGACRFFAGTPRWRWRSFVPAVAGAAVVGSWLDLAARTAFTYFSYPVHGLVTAVRQMAAGSDTDVALPDNPRWEIAIQLVGLIVLSTVVMLGLHRLLRHRYRGAWWWAVVSGSALFFLGSAVRVAGAQGPELAGRASTFTFVPMSMLVGAVVLGRRCGLDARHGGRGRYALRYDLPVPGWRPATWRLVRAWLPAPPPGSVARRSAYRLLLVAPAVAGTALLTLSMLGARAGGWPPYWGRLPGPHLVSAYERSVDPAGVSAARWAGARLPPGDRAAADSVGYTLVSTYGGQDPVGDAADLYYATAWSDPLLHQLYSLSVDYLWVDLRTDNQLPRSGSYFPQDPLAQRHDRPIDRAGLDKFDHVQGVSRVYDNGVIRIYDTRRA